MLADSMRFKYRKERPKKQYQLLIGLIISFSCYALGEPPHKHEEHTHHHHGKTDNTTSFDPKTAGNRKIAKDKNNHKINLNDKKALKSHVPENLIPPSPILNIEEAIASFQIHPDFEIDVIASEPLVFDPVIAKYDAAGRLWVVEMTTYMQDINATGEMEYANQIAVITDTDNDGKLDKRQVVIDKLLLPRALSFVDKGILWADNTALYFSEMINVGHEVKIINTELIDDSYAKGGNMEHKPSGMLFSLDNWYYNTRTFKRYRVLPLDRLLPRGSKEIYRNNHWKMVMSDTEVRGQWGITQDDYGRLYSVNNSSPLQTTSFLASVAMRNPKYEFPIDLLEQSVGTADVYPARVTPGLNEGHAKIMYRDGYRLKANTAACGPLIYRGNQFPKKYYGIGLTQEPAGNLVKATKIIDNNGVISGQDLFEQKEILASTDERFRPVNAENTPDGTIMLVDMYHGIIQQKQFLTSYLANQIKERDLEKNKHFGRVYRLRSKEPLIKNIPYLDKLTASQLVPYLTHDNGWHRDMAKYLLVMKQDKATIPALTKVALNTSNHLAQIKALWVLESYNAVSLNLLKQVSLTSNDKVKRSIYRIAEVLPSTNELRSWLAKEATNTSLEPSHNLALAAGVHKAWPAISHIINRFGLNDFVIAALGHKEGEYLAVQGDKIPGPENAKLTTIHHYVDVSKGKRELKGQALSLVKLGQQLYNGKAGCAGCHGQNGKGSSTIPPLDKSEYVNGDKYQLVALMMHGIAGPITVNGKHYNSIMPAMKHNKSLDINDYASLASYIRFAWSNDAPHVSRWDVILSGRASSEQTGPFTAETLKSVKITAKTKLKK